MSYTFCLCQLHPKCPDLTGWMLAIRPTDPVGLLMEVHRGVISLYYNKFGLDPHIQADEFRRGLYNPIKLAAGWLQTADKFLIEGETILVNVNGGMMCAKEVTILETIERDKIDWTVRYEDERITISRWPEGEHYYLCSSKNRIFVPDKYHDYADALKAAHRYVPVARIISKGC
jgi:hypothetical protein